MTLKLNAREVYEMAARIERNGADFYRTAAKRLPGPDVQEILEELAEMEDSHEDLFELLKSTIAPESSPEATFDCDEQSLRYLHAAADTHVFNVYEHSDALKGMDTPEDVLKTALAFEKDTVVFFVSLHELVPEELGKREVARLLREELDHVASLTARLNELQHDA